MSYSTKGQHCKFSLQNSVFRFDLGRDTMNYFPEIWVQILGCIWKTGYDTLLQISVNEHTISAEMFSGSYKKK